eukprot:bmy_07247T0
MSSGNAKIGHCAPKFKATAVMPDGQFKDISLSDYRGKYVVFFFYPLDFTFVCPTEIIAFSDRAEEFKKLNFQITINDLPVGRSVDETLRLVQALQFTDKHGEVCPAGWKPGSDTIKPDVQKSQEYFSKKK